jgi:hypothetical protein
MGTLVQIGRLALIALIFAVWDRLSEVHGSVLDGFMMALLAWALFMDVCDRWLLGTDRQSEIQSFLAVSADRVVELTLWIFFATSRDSSGEALVALWVPILAITRTVLADFVRSVCAGGPHVVGDSGMVLRRVLRESQAPWLRPVQVGSTGICFCVLALLRVVPEPVADALSTAASWLILLAVSSTLFGAVPDQVTMWRWLLRLDQSQIATANSRLRHPEGQESGLTATRKAIHRQTLRKPGTVQKGWLSKSFHDH